MYICKEFLIKSYVIFQNLEGLRVPIGAATNRVETTMTPPVDLPDHQHPKTFLAAASINKERPPKKPLLTLVNIRLRR